ncbi:hypothetical protein BKI52_29980 [marine bacterium AO1-C]|nr:hypothetical protein BKI52_29980 [marine bacterium AO1-C]
MKKILTITILLLLSVSWAVMAQDSTQQKYKKNKLVKAEADFLFSYYQQDGNNAAVTGGLGTELLNNVATNTGFSLVYQDKRENLHSFSFNVGVDSYTSASSDNIDPNTISSASSGDVHVYPSLSWELDNQKKRFTIGANLSYSTEYDYVSRGAGISFSKYSPNRNRELSVSLSAFWDQWSLIFPKELRPPKPPGASGDDDDDDDYATTPRNSYSASIVYNQVINKRLQIALLTDVVYQQGWLSTPFHRVYFQGQTQAKIEHLPDTRFKLPFGIRANYFVSDFLILRGYYRYYWDNWGLTAHTLNLEAPFKMFQGVSFYPFARLYTQNQAQYFAPYRQHNLTETFFTSDYDLSGFSSQFVGVGLRLAPPKGILIKPLSALSVRYGMYRRSTGLASDIFTVNLTYKFK